VKLGRVTKFTSIASSHDLQISQKLVIFLFVHSPTELTQLFREKQLKLTPQRQLLFSLLHQNDSHPSAESLFEVASKQMPGISLRTVYQTLGELAEMGELQLVDVGLGAKRFDPNMDDHQHFVCDSCGSIRDVEISAAPKMRGVGSAGCEVDEVGVVFHGRCKQCASINKSNNKSNKRSPGQQAKQKASDKS